VPNVEYPNQLEEELTTRRSGETTSKYWSSSSEARPQIPSLANGATHSESDLLTNQTNKQYLQRYILPDTTAFITQKAPRPRSSVVNSSGSFGPGLGTVRLPFLIVQEWGMVIGAMS
jgi:hypothetical protein